MTVFLGTGGRVELKRADTGAIFSSTVKIADVNAGKDRFSFDFPTGMLVTGDRVQLRATDGGLLSFVTAAGWPVNAQQDRGTWFVNVDEIGGIRLYSNFGDSLNGEATGRIDLAAPGRDIPIQVNAVDAGTHMMGQVALYELNNAREAVDTTDLSSEFRQQHSGLISGSGTIECSFDYRKTLLNGQQQEMPAYLHQLVLRQQLGSRISAKLFMVTPGAADGDAADDSLWFEFDAIITNSSISLVPGAITTSRFEFVTSGPIRYKAKTNLGNYLLQQSNSRIQLEQDTNSDLELEYPA